MSTINRRQLLKYLGLSGVSAGLVLTGCEKKEGNTHAHEGGEHQHGEAGTDNAGVSERDQTLLKQKFFTDHERKTVTVLADLIFPKDDHSGNASEAGVPQFIEFMMLDQPQRQIAMRGGLRWLHNRSLKAHGKDFLEASEAQQTAILDEIAWPAKAKPEVSQGVAFFNNFRDLAATGFWTSEIGVKDLQYLGNTANPDWNGCPDEQMKKLGVSYDA
jgi:hypothetical protein